MNPSDKALIIFVKNPELGLVKTRLAATVGDERALQIYLALLERTRQIALAVKAERYLFYSRRVEEQDEWSRRDFHKMLQEGADLGERMLNAFRAVLQRHPKAVIIGSDCAALTPGIIRAAFGQLEEYDYVLGPATDGGYYLLGLREPRPELFGDMPWSTHLVLPLTIERIESGGRRYYLLQELSDIDNEEDWVKFGWELK